jgi:iron complex outermembrane receptor protein
VRTIYLTIIFLLTGIISTNAQSKAIAINNEPVVLTDDAETGSIQGKITTMDNQPAAYVTVSLKEMDRFTATDERGFFLIRNIKPGNYILQVSMAGLQPQEKHVSVKARDISSIDFSLAENQKQLEEVIITSRKTLNQAPISIGKIAINPMDLPQSIATVGQGVIREQQAQRLSDVLKNVSGINMVDVRGNVQERFIARGYNFGNSNLFKNGARINSGSMPEMSSLERVEVLKGSSAILFGQVAPGGIINMVTKQPKFNRGGEISMRAGSYDLYKPAIDFYGPISSSIAYRINGTFESAGSFRDKVSSERYYVNPSLLFKLGTRTELMVEGDYLKHDFTPDFGIGTLDGKIIPNVPRYRFMGTDWQYSKTEQTTVTTTINHQLNDNWKLNSSFSYQFYKRDYYAVERIQAKADGDWTRPLGRVLTDESYYTGQVNLVGKFNTSSIEHSLLAGADADHYLTTNNDFTFPAVVGLPAGSYDKINILNPGKYVQRTDIPVATRIRKREAPVDRFGVYAQDLIKLSSKFNLLAGIRWSYVETKGIDSANILTNAKTTGKTRYDQAFSPRVGLVYKPFKTTSVFASYSNSFNTNTGQDIDGKTLEPSIIDQYELGVKNEFLNGAFSVNITAYRIKNNNLAQTAPYLKDGVTQNNNSNIKMLSGETTSDGIEVDLAAHPVNGLNITAGYSYNYMRYTKTDTSAGSFKEGEKLVSNPAHTANGSIFYTVSKGKLSGFKAGITVIYIGDRFGGWNTDVVKTTNSSGKIVGPFTYRSRIFPVEGFATVDVTAGYTYKKISLLAKVSNLTNTLNYYVHENYSINPIPPTQFLATVGYKF